MVDRVYMRGSPPRLITSKAGFNASPALNDVNKTFDSDWFNGGGIKFKYYGPAIPTYYFPYALDFIPRFFIQAFSVWNGNNQDFYWEFPGSPGFQVDPPNAAIINWWQWIPGTAKAYNDRIEVIATFPERFRLSILVFES